MKLNHKKAFEFYLKSKFPDIQTEHRFHPVRRWRIDYALVDKKIGFEYDGSAFNYGRHSRGVGMQKDNEKINTAQLMGWKIYRVCTGQDYTNLIDCVEELI